MDIRAGVDSKGTIVGFDFTQFYPQYRGETVQTTAELVGTPLVAGSAGGVKASTSMYTIANNRQLLKSIPLRGNWIKADWMRGGSATHNTFAVEQVVDELARAAGMDPVAFRIQNVTTGDMKAPLLAVLDAATKAANWKPRVTASNLSDAKVVTGRGVAWSNLDKTGVPTAAVADIEVDRTTGKITPKHVWHAVSAGLSVYVGGVQNQADAGAVQTASRLLLEQVRYTQTNVTSVDFVTYPTLRFKDSPKVTAIVLQRSDVQPQGVGEPMANVAGAAIANAFFDATGVRLTTAPLTPARVRAALKAAVT
jgi:CO/xanthine dehydrogenase Mo-binding subunit